MRSLFIASLLLATSACSSSIPQTSALPLKRLRVYETGVGYFERSGTLSHDEHAGLPVPTGHLDDALKTLVVLSEGGRAENAGVEFGSSLSRGMARAMAGLPTDDNASAVDVRDPPASARGVARRAQDAEAIADGSSRGRRDDQRRERKQTHVRVTVLTDRAEVVHVDGTDIESVRPTDPAQAARIDAALEALLAHGAANKRVLDFLGKSGAPITLGYIAETPVWRTTYRLVIGSDHKATLQAWALLHNDTDEAWRDVKVELASGRPDSFLFPLAAPRYARRELVAPKNELSTVPQLMSKTPDGIWGDHTGESEGAGGMGMSGSGEGGGGSGYGYGLGSIGTIGHGAGTRRIELAPRGRRSRAGRAGDGRRSRRALRLLDAGARAAARARVGARAVHAADRSRRSDRVVRVTRSFGARGREVRERGESNAPTRHDRVLRRRRFFRRIRDRSDAPERAALHDVRR